MEIAMHVISRKPFNDAARMYPNDTEALQALSNGGAMMRFTAIREKAQALFGEAGFIGYIADEGDYASALALMNELIEDAESNRVLIGIVAHSIERWENESAEFAEFNARVAGLNGVDVLRLLMEQHGLGVADLPEIGSKSLVSKILNARGRNLTKDHISALSKRFGISPAVFF